MVSTVDAVNQCYNLPTTMASIMDGGNRTVDPTAVAKRLKEALDYRGRSISWLQRELEIAGVEGSKYSNVQRYVAGKGKAPPPLDWIEGVVRVLDIRAAWLGFGEGAMTWEQELEERAKQRWAGDAWTEVIQAVQTTFLGKGSTRLEEDPAARTAVIEAVSRIDRTALDVALHQQGRRVDVPPGIPDDWRLAYFAAVSLGRVLGAPFNEENSFGRMDPASRAALPDPAFRDYIASVCQGYHRLADIYRIGGPEFPRVSDLKREPESAAGDTTTTPEG